MVRFTHIGQYWSAGHREVRVVGISGFSLSEDGAMDGAAWDITDSLRLPLHRRRFREAHRGGGWHDLRWTYSRLPFPGLELIESLDGSGRDLVDWAGDGMDTGSLPPELPLAGLDRAPSPEIDHLVAPVLPRRAMAFGVTYLNSALERETEGRIRDYGYVYRAVKERGERPELFLKGTSPEQFVGPNGRMGLRSDRTNSVTIDGEPCERTTVSSGIEPELAAVVDSKGRIQGYTLADDVSGNRIENETLLYLAQAKHFTGALVLGPLLFLSSEQENPGLGISTRILSSGGDVLFERSSDTSRINAPLSELISWASSHIRLTPGEVFSTGTDVVPDGRVKVLEEGMTVEMSCPEIGRLRHGAGRVSEDAELNLDYSRLELDS